MAQTVKNLSAMWQTGIWSLGQEDPLKEMVTHSGIHAWRSPGTEEPGGLQSVSQTRLNIFHFHIFT